MNDYSGSHWWMHDDDDGAERCDALPCVDLSRWMDVFHLPL